MDVWMDVPLLVLFCWHALFLGFPLFLFNGETKIILGGWWSDEDRRWRGGRYLGYRRVRRVYEVGLVDLLYQGILPQGPLPGCNECARHMPTCGTCRRLSLPSPPTTIVLGASLFHHKMTLDSPQLVRVPSHVGPIREQCPVEMHI
jgi:hypothetical protein